MIAINRNYLTATLAAFGPLTVAGLQVQSSSIFHAANANASSPTIYMDCGSGEFTLYEFSVAEGKLQQKVLEKQKYDKLAKGNGNKPADKEVFNKCEEKRTLANGQTKDLFPKKTAFVNLLCDANERFMPTTAKNMAKGLDTFLKDAGYPEGAPVTVDPGFTGSNRELFLPNTSNDDEKELGLALMASANELLILVSKESKYNIKFERVEPASVVLAKNEALYENDSITFLFDNVDQQWLYDTVLMAPNVVANPVKTWMDAIVYRLEIDFPNTKITTQNFVDKYGDSFADLVDPVLKHFTKYAARFPEVVNALGPDGAEQYGKSLFAEVQLDCGFAPQLMAEIIISSPKLLVPFAGQVLFVGHLARGSGSFQGSRKNRTTKYVEGFSAVLGRDIDFSEGFKKQDSGLFMGISGTVHGATSMDRVAVEVTAFRRSIEPTFNIATQMIEHKVEHVPVVPGPVLLSQTSGIKHMVWSQSDFKTQCNVAGTYLNERNSQTIKDIKEAAEYMMKPDAGSIIIFLRDWNLDGGVQANAGWCLGKYLKDSKKFGENDTFTSDEPKPATRPISTDLAGQ